MAVDRYFSQLALSEENSKLWNAPENTSNFMYDPSLFSDILGKPETLESKLAVISKLHQNYRGTIVPGSYGTQAVDPIPINDQLKTNQKEDHCQKSDLNMSEILNSSRINAMLEKDSEKTSTPLNTQRVNDSVHEGEGNSLKTNDENYQNIDKTLVSKSNERFKTQPSRRTTLQSKAKECPKEQMLGAMRIDLRTNDSYFKDNGVTIIDPIRAALTWQENEITGYDLIDPDDDGEGINGIGFRPTPMESYIRIQKRKKQLAAYRNQEAKDARNLRKERRNCVNRGTKDPKEERKLTKRVRFKGVEVKNLPS